ncbi:MAG: prepilin-type N-terminal cleavage/methylation domain-containing protein [Planctomycetota bacterium]|jgi:prepilin-type N-terminal cleavage/methylation domain-containing protein|nr:prepilin-type N-terminal cleavage/methylation domain-containing protein [Planctomycetota bacterium]
MKQLLRQTGFTLVEVLVAIAITAMIMVSVSGAFLGLLQAREEVEVLSESTEAGPRILALLERDLEGLWHYNVEDNAVFLARNMNVAGFDADRIDFLTTTDAVGVIQDIDGHAQNPTVCEVGYWLKENQDIPGLLELWRREDAMVDDDLRSGGQFQLVHDRVKNFNITYFETLGHDAEDVLDWDSSAEDTLPRRMKIEFALERKLANRNRVSGFEVSTDANAAIVKYSRHIVLDRRYPDILKAGVALIPIAPPRPVEEGGSAGGGAAGGSQTNRGNARPDGNKSGGQGGDKRGGETGRRNSGDNGGRFNLNDLFKGSGGNLNQLFGNRGGGGRTP